MLIGEILKEKRKEYQLTQEQVSEKIFVSRKTISNWETGKTTPDIESLIRLANLFDLSLDNLLLEGSDIVEKIKKQQKFSALSKWYALFTVIFFVFLLIQIRLIYIGFEDRILSYLLILANIITFGILAYFSKRIKE
ncbi:helix-turn-helix domain-containing protein [Vagococcus fluvialis]|uniref:helix-turn-helix domain-containing protein n=1 Tax=Vagococcus fluvialis TaxID=2738 RepID=UPI001D09EB70|nr:helix-turn-helix transcriptional regulator [Vagococcus fluvialis]UDM84117.1 helix-turn-helix domain-containing protein [Vagococcus fluvialis]